MFVRNILKKALHCKQYYIEPAMMIIICQKTNLHHQSQQECEGRKQNLEMNNNIKVKKYKKVQVKKYFTYALLS